MDELQLTIIVHTDGWDAGSIDVDDGFTIHTTDKEHLLSCIKRILEENLDLNEVVE